MKMKGEDPVQENVRAHYEAAAENYEAQYERKRLRDLEADYPANYFRLQLLLNAFASKNIKRVVEVGVGEGTPLTTLAGAGIEVWGFDIAARMVEKARQRMAENNLPPERIQWGDIQDPLTYARVMEGGVFDGLMAMGVMPHVANDGVVLDNMAALVRPGGRVFIEFRNKLFSLFTFNRHTYDFILDDLLRDVSPQIREQVGQDLATRLRLDQPACRTSVNGGKAPGYDDIPAKFHNPFEVVEMFERHNFSNIRLLWYHYHPAMPALEEQMPQDFRDGAIALEHEQSGWRGFFLCSAFVVEAQKNGS